MPVIVVTRLRLKEPGLLDEFFTAAAAVLDQALKSAGNLGADALADANKCLVECDFLAGTRADAGFRAD